MSVVLIPLEDMLMSVIVAYNPECMAHVLWWVHACNQALMEHGLWRLMLITILSLSPREGDGAS